MEHSFCLSTFKLLWIICVCVCMTVYCFLSLAKTELPEATHTHKWWHKQEKRPIYKRVYEQKKKENIKLLLALTIIEVHIRCFVHCLMGEKKIRARISSCKINSFPCPLNNSYCEWDRCSFRKMCSCSECIKTKNRMGNAQSAWYTHSKKHKLSPKIVVKLHSTASKSTGHRRK